MDGPAELQRERAVACAGLEDLDGRRAAGGDVDVEEGYDGGCVEGVDLPLLLRQPVGPRQQGRDGTGRDGTDGTRTGVTSRRTFVTYSSMLGKVAQYCVPLLEVIRLRVVWPMMAVCAMVPWCVSTFLVCFSAVVSSVVELSFRRRSSAMSPSARACVS